MNKIENSNSSGFLFDIDGVLTKPISNKPAESVIDPEILIIINDLIIKHPLAFITGRSKCWLDEQFIQHINQENQLIAPIFMEYGLVYLYQNKLTITDKGLVFREKIYPHLLSYIEEESKKLGYYFEQKTYCNFPAHGSLWIEKKYTMLSIASNRDIEPMQVHLMIEKLPLALKNQVRIVKHHLGIDILPKGTSKSDAVQTFLKFNLSQNIDTWYVFGDNPSDKEMTNPLSKWRYFDTKENASEDTKKFLTSILSKID